jgi:nucleotide-binding universal stress UspA family protein
MTASGPGNESAMTDTPEPTGPRPVVVGVDGSADSMSAADLAAAEAAVRGVPLEIVHGFAPALLARPATVPPDVPPMATLPEPVEAELRANAEQMLHEAAARVRADNPALPVITRLHDGAPTAVLTAASHHAAVVVVGHRGAGGFTGLLAGSVAVQLVSHAAAPVIVARGEPAFGATAPVVVGVDGSEASQRAAAFAIECAAHYRCPLVLLHAWAIDSAWPPELAMAGYPPPTEPDVVADVVGDLPTRYPEVTVRSELRKDAPAHESLVMASEGARLVVVGSRGRGGFRGLLLGSVSQALIHHAHCPVAVIGPEATASSVS